MLTVKGSEMRMMTVQEAISCLEGVLCGAELLETDVDDIADLLREQESVEPLAIRKDIVDEVYDWIAECPACGMTWAMWHPDRMRFCPSCGKAVKWDAAD